MTATLACAVALAGLPGIGPPRLRGLIERWGPEAAWQRVLAGAEGPAWAAAARALDPAAELDRHSEMDVDCLLLGSPRYPGRLSDDPEAPAVVFCRGSPAALDRPLTAIVGTRRCTHAGRRLARRLGEELARAGVGVVSGLALGIDGAAHEGALAAGPEAAPPVAVVGSGLDVVYPRRHGALWHDVAARGLLVSEWPLGTRPEPWRFPARNRLLAALADVVVVVESHVAGGSLHTVEAADVRGCTVLAVPGAVGNPAAAGTNRLIFDGYGVARDTDDVLAALGLATAGAPLTRAADALVPSHAINPHRPPDPAAAAVLDAVGWEPVATEELLVRTGLDPPVLAAALARLEHDEWVRGDAGWWERTERSK